MRRQTAWFLRLQKFGSGGRRGTSTLAQLRVLSRHSQLNTTALTPGITVMMRVRRATIALELQTVLPPSSTVMMRRAARGVRQLRSNHKPLYHRGAEAQRGRDRVRSLTVM